MTNSQQLEFAHLVNNYFQWNKSSTRERTEFNVIKHVRVRFYLCFQCIDVLHLLQSFSKL